MDTQLLILIAAKATLFYVGFLLFWRLLSRGSFDGLVGIDWLMVLILVVAGDDILRGTLTPRFGWVVIGSAVAWHFAHMWRVRPVPKRAGAVAGGLAPVIAHGDSRRPESLSPALASRYDPPAEYPPAGKE